MTAWDAFFGGSIQLSPLMPLPTLLPLLALACVLVLIGLLRGVRGSWWRVLLLLVLVLTLLNPAWIQEQRSPLTDVAAIIVDDSPSQATGERRVRTEAALAHLQQTLRDRPGLEVRVIRSGGGSGDTGQGDGAPIDRTELFADLTRAFADVPPNRRAGAILITDGQVHDVPLLEGMPRLGPVHTLLTGERAEIDRRLDVVSAPAFGIVGKETLLTVRVEDQPGGQSGPAELIVRKDGTELGREPVQPGQNHEIAILLDHGGANVVEVEVAAIAGELTLANNRVAMVVNGVRDRLRVLLVSGEPHPGERTWRSLLKADPAVDLVHFTILRPPEKQDGTPIRELSLIAFPIRELFEIKLDEFDLIIFDRYRRRGVLPNLYLDNVADYVRRGGALLVSSGPGFIGAYSLYSTPLGDILPAAPTGTMLEQPFKPQIADIGQRHPVTQGLLPPGTTEPSWGRWFRQVDVSVLRGTTVMTGIDNQPLLVLDRVGDGRVAQLLSDHIWLWSRGFEGGGPQGELLRRLAHWLMKEPELEENALRAHVDGRRITLERQSLDKTTTPVTVTTPSGATLALELQDQPDGRTRASLMADEVGLYQFVEQDQPERRAVAVIGSLNPPELADLRTTEQKLAPISRATGGAMLWLEDEPTPAIRRTAPDRDHSGRDWLGLTANGESVVTGTSRLPLLPVILPLLLALTALVMAWWREST